MFWLTLSTVLVSVVLCLAPIVIERARDRGQSTLEFLLLSAQACWRWVVVKCLVRSNAHIHSAGNQAGIRESETNVMTD